MTVKMLMMHFMCPSNGPDVTAVASCKPFETLMNNNIMNEKISKSISHDTEANRLHPPYMIERAVKNKQDAWYSEDDKKCVVLLEETRLYLMMILVQVPEKTMHDITMCKPGNTFHNKKCGSQNKYVV